MTDERWIEIPNWDRFQHYKKRHPPWIKNYLELMHDDNYRELSMADRGVLHGLWLEYASSRRALRGDTAGLTRRLGQRVTSAQLKRLNEAGFIHFVASTPLAIRARATETEAETEAETEKSKAKQSTEASYDSGLETLGKELEQWIGQTPTRRR